MKNEIAKGVSFAGVQDPERKVFDELIPLPYGTSYNSYIIQGSEKTALIDTADLKKIGEYVRLLDTLGVKKVDYIVSNHAEQDHSGAIPAVLERYPGSKVVTNAKCKEMLKDLLGVEDSRFQVINEGDRLRLGGKTLQFIMAPWAHWPETMVTYLEEDQILFPCDLFGSHLATDELIMKNEKRAFTAAKMYYAEIMMPFRQGIKKHIEKIEKLSLKMIAPSHGQVYSDPKVILDWYRDWTSDDVKNTALILYVSMHGSTLRMAKELDEDIRKYKIETRMINMAEPRLGEIATEAVDAATIVIATPAFLGGAHPLAVNTIYILNALKPKARFAAVIGSFGWGVRVEEQVKALSQNIKAEFLMPVMVKGLPKKDDLSSLASLAEEIMKHHKDAGLIKGD